MKECAESSVIWLLFGLVASCVADAPLQATGSRRLDAGTPLGGVLAGRVPVSTPVAATSSAPSAEVLDPDFGQPMSEWDYVPTVQRCKLRTARNPSSVWPALAWQEVRPGLARRGLFPVEEGAPRSGASGMAGMGNGADEALLTYVTKRAPDSDGYVLLSVNATTDLGIAISVLEGQECYLMAGGSASPRRGVVLDLGDSKLVQAGWIVRGSSSINWSAPTQFSVAYSWPFDDGIRWGQIAGLAAIQVTSDPLSSTLHQVYSSPDLLRTPWGVDGTVYWTEGYTNYGRVMALDSMDKVHVVHASETYYPTIVAAGDGVVSWVGAIGPRVTDGILDQVWLFGCSWSPGAGPCEQETLAELPVQNASHHMDLNEGWIAVYACDNEAVCLPYVLRRADRRLFRLAAPPGMVSTQVLGLVGDFLYTIGLDEKTFGSGNFSEFVRYDLTQVEDLSTP